VEGQAAGALSAPRPPWRRILVAVAESLRVEPRHLSLAAHEFELAAEGLSEGLALLAAATCPEPALFGSLPAARAALAGYQEKAREAVDGLRAAASALEQDVAAGLRASAAGYLAVEEANLPR
jgi:hypothetical protein